MAEEANGEVILFSRKILLEQNRDLVEKLKSIKLKKEAYENENGIKSRDILLLDDGLLKYKHVDQNNSIIEKAYFRDEDIKIPGVHRNNFVQHTLYEVIRYSQDYFSLIYIK